MSNIKPVDASAFATLSVSDLTSVCGGEGSSNSNSQSTTVTPELKCPPGTSPHWRQTTGEGSGEASGGLWSGKAQGQGTRQEFWCDPIPAQPKNQSQGSN